jgi:hypothetical protein
MGTREHACSQRQQTTHLHHPQLSQSSPVTKTSFSHPDSSEAVAEAAQSEGIRDPSKAAGGPLTGRNLCEKSIRKSM